jgi:hypothetical protein
MAIIHYISPFLLCLCFECKFRIKFILKSAWPSRWNPSTRGKAVNVLIPTAQRTLHLTWHNCIWWCSCCSILVLISGNSMRMSCLSLSYVVEWYSSRCVVTVSHICEEMCMLNMPARGMLWQRSRSSKADGMEVVSSMLNLHVFPHGNLHCVVS